MKKRGRVVSEGEIISSGRGFGRVLGESEGRPVRVVIESSTRWEWAAKTFESLGAEAVIIDARKIRVIAETKHKTDRTDARILADLARTDALPKPIWRADRDTRCLSRRSCQAKPDGAPMKIIAFLTEPDVVHKIVRHVENGGGDDPFEARAPPA